MAQPGPSTGAPQVVLGTQLLALQPDAQTRECMARAEGLGATWLDTADMYGRAPGDAERGIAPWARRIPVATKGGLTRRGNRWVPDGRASHLRAAAHASLERLGVERIALYFLHAVDPRVSLRTSVGALAKLKERGVIERIGLCNVTAHQLRLAQAVADVDCVQVPVSPFDLTSLSSGIVEACLAEGIELWGYRPFGGRSKIARIRKHPAIEEASQEEGCTPEEVVLRWMLDLRISPLPGPTRPETVDSCVRAGSVPLGDDARRCLDVAFPRHAHLRVPRTSRAPDPAAEGCVRIVMGSPGSAKSTRARHWVSQGYARLNRDERGGTLKKLLTPLDALLAEGKRHVVLDNTYASRASRTPVIEVAWAHGVPVACEWMDTPDEDCERNVVERILEQTSTLPEPEDFARLAKSTPGVIPPRALHGYRSNAEPPSEDEGFTSITTIPFERVPTGSVSAIIVDPIHLEPLAPVLTTAPGPILVVGWDPDRSREASEEAVRQQAAALGLTAHVAMCPHGAGPPLCWCRKPLVGLAVWLARAHDVNLSDSVVYATRAADRTLGRKLGARIAETPEQLLAPS